MNALTESANYIIFDRRVGNGVGKSTFLKILTGQQDIDSGEISTGETVVFGKPSVEITEIYMGVCLMYEDNRGSNYRTPDKVFLFSPNRNL